MAAAENGNELLQVVALLGAGVVAAPIFIRLGLGSVLGYLAAGLAIGPFGLALFTNPQAILHVAELGVVMFLFVIGLEMQPSRLWSLRRDIFGLGATQVVVCGLLLTGVAMAFGLTPKVAFFAAMGFVLTSTAVVAQILAERGDTATPEGQRMVSILLLEDLAIVPLLALVAFLAPGGEEGGEPTWLAILIAIAAIALVLGAGRWLLNPFFRLLAAAQAREVMTAAALLVVLGSALIMQVSGLSMAMGAFLAGVLLSESQLPPSARGRYRAVPRHPARPVLSRRRHVARSVGAEDRLAHHRRRRGLLHGDAGDGHLFRRAPVQGAAPRGAVSRRAVCAGRRVRLRAVCRSARRRHFHRRASTR